MEGFFPGIYVKVDKDTGETERVRAAGAPPPRLYASALQMLSSLRPSPDLQTEDPESVAGKNPPWKCT